MIAVTEVVPWLFDMFEALLGPLVPDSEQLSLQQRRAIETSGILSFDLAVLQQSGIFAFAQDSIGALTPTAPLARAMMIMKLNARCRILHKLYLAV
jgi:hypothetical protein